MEKAKGRNSSESRKEGSEPRDKKTVLRFDVQIKVLEGCQQALKPEYPELHWLCSFSP